MCLNCHEICEIECSFCGTECWGRCEDPDTCVSCWLEKHDDTGMSMIEDLEEDVKLDRCIEFGCLCKCHDDVYNEGVTRYENGVWKDDLDDPPYDRTGVFPFLKLPGEIREKIYGYAFLKDGNRRKTLHSFHRGTIHTSLLSTCRQVYKEAGNLPLSLNQLDLPNAMSGIDFLGFSLSFNQKHLCTSVNIELGYHELHGKSFEILFRELGKLPLSHLRLVIKGGYPKEAFSGYKCFTSRMVDNIKGLKSFEVLLGSYVMTEQDKEDIQEEMREALMPGHKPPKQPKSSKGKRKATTDLDSADANTKKAKKTKTKVSHWCSKPLAPLINDW